MKTNDVVNILRERIPQLINSFHSTQSILTLTASSGVATATLSTANTTIKTGEKVLITGALVNNPILSLSHLNGLATAITQNDHDLTEGYSNITISGATQNGYNGTFNLVEVIDNKTFTFIVPQSTVSPATGSPVLMENVETHFNGYYVITKLSDTQFTYNIESQDTMTATGTKILNYNFRIYGAVDIERGLEAYTPQNINTLYLCVEAEKEDVNRSQSNRLDNFSFSQEGVDPTQWAYQGINIYCIAPCKDDMLALTYKDSMDDLKAIIFMSLLNLNVNSYLTNSKTSNFTYKGAEPYLYDKTKYVHKFSFEVCYEITQEDMAIQEKGVAFRNIEFNWLNQTEVDSKKDTIKLPN